MIIDSHYHLDERIQSLENLFKKMEEHGIDKTALMPFLSDPIPDTSEFLLKVLRFLLYRKPFRRIVGKLASDFDKDGDIKLPSGLVKIYPDPDNQAVADVVEKYPDKFLWWIFVNPKGENDIVEEYEKWKDKTGVIGVKAHPFWHRYSPVELLPVAEKLSETGKPLIIHAGFDLETTGNFQSLIKKVPGLKLILAHAGFPGIKETWKEIKDNKNILVDLSATAYVNEKCIKDVVTYLGVERCLFGSDGPYGPHSSDGIFNNGLIKGRIEKLFPDKGVQNRILGENFIEFAGL